MSLPSFDGRQKGAMMEERITRPLTPKLRGEINQGIQNERIELESCQRTPYVTLQLSSLEALELLIDRLPDGYPVPMKITRK